MISLACSARWKTFMQGSRGASSLAGHYVGGRDLNSAMTTAGKLLGGKIRSSFFYLGEYVDSKELVRENVAAKMLAAQKIPPTGMDTHISVDPTQVGAQLGWEMATENMRRIAGEIATNTDAHTGIHCVMLDMEDYPANQITIDLHDQMAADGLPVALTLQAYLRKTEQDLERQIEKGARVRLVKGAFYASEDVAFAKRAEIKENHRRLIAMMLSENARQTGFYPIIATHDDALHDFAIHIARENGWQQGQYEFEMLYGVRSNLAQRLAERGERVRLYLPFGSDWWPYAVRRIGENPANAVLLLRSLISSN